MTSFYNSMIMKEVLNMAKKAHLSFTNDFSLVSHLLPLSPLNVILCLQILLSLRVWCYTHIHTHKPLLHAPISSPCWMDVINIHINSWLFGWTWCFDTDVGAWLKLLTATVLTIQWSPNPSETGSRYCSLSVYPPLQTKHTPEFSVIDRDPRGRGFVLWTNLYSPE